MDRVAIHEPLRSHVRGAESGGDRLTAMEDFDRLMGFDELRRQRLGED